MCAISYINDKNQTLQPFKEMQLSIFNYKLQFIPQLAISIHIYVEQVISGH